MDVCFCSGLVYGNGEQLEFDFDTQRETADSRNYTPPNFSQAELRKIDISDAADLGKDYVSPLSIPGSSFKNVQQSSSALSFVIDPNVRNLPPLPSEVVNNFFPSLDAYMILKQVVSFAAINFWDLMRK